MKRALILAAASTFGLAAPALAQHAGHTMPAAPQAAAPAAADDPACPPEHAAMGHCTPKSAASANPHAGHTMAPPAVQAADPHAGHTMTAPTAPAAAAASDPSCPPEHAAMGHCKPAATPPAQPAADPHAGHNMAAPQPPASDPNCPPEHAAMGHCKPATTPPPAADPHAGHATSGSTPTTAPPVAPPPKGAFSGPEHAADTVWDPKLMAKKRANELRAEHGGYTGYMVLVDQFEYRAVEGRDGYFLNAEAWYGGDYDRLWLKSEIESDRGRKPEQAEVQALWSRALDPWFNLQTGVRYDFRPDPERAHLVVGIQGLAPYWFEVDGAFFLSDEGDVTARLEAEYDQRITQRLILQPRMEVDFALQDVPEIGVGAGLSKAEFGVRLRYEIKREFAPYIGVEYNRTFGDTADFARAEGEKVSHLSFVVGLRSWF